MECHTLLNAVIKCRNGCVLLSRLSASAFCLLLPSNLVTYYYLIDNIDHGYGTHREEFVSLMFTYCQCALFLLSTRKDNLRAQCRFSVYAAYFVHSVSQKEFCLFDGGRKNINLKNLLQLFCWAWTTCHEDHLCSLNSAGIIVYIFSNMLQLMFRELGTSMEIWGNWCRKTTMGNINSKKSPIWVAPLSHPLFPQYAGYKQLNI